MGDEGQLGAGSQERLERRHFCRRRRGNVLLRFSGMEKGGGLGPLGGGEKGPGWLLCGRRTLIVSSLLGAVSR